jgi:hypothetical protein
MVENIPPRFDLPRLSARRGILGINGDGEGDRIAGDGEGDRDELCEGERDGDLLGDLDGLGDGDLLGEGDGDLESDTLTDGDLMGDGDGDGDRESDTLTDGDLLGDGDGDGDRDLLGDGEGDRDGDIARDGDRARDALIVGDRGTVIRGERDIIDRNGDGEENTPVVGTSTRGSAGRDAPVGLENDINVVLPPVVAIASAYCVLTFVAISEPHASNHNSSLSSSLLPPFFFISIFAILSRSAV